MHSGDLLACLVPHALLFKPTTEISSRRTDGRTDGQTDGQRDGRTDTPSYKDARTHLKMGGQTYSYKWNPYQFQILISSTKWSFYPQITSPLWSKIEKNTGVSTGPLAGALARTAHLFAWSGLIASLAPSAGLTHSLARSLRSLPRSWDSEWLDGYYVCVFSHFRP